MEFFSPMLSPPLFVLNDEMKVPCAAQGLGNCPWVPNSSGLGKAPSHSGFVSLHWWKYLQHCKNSLTDQKQPGSN